METDAKGRTLISARSGFAFDNVARWNLKTKEGLIAKGNLSSVIQPGDEGAIASLYASMIFDLFVYLEGNLNNGFRKILGASSIPSDRKESAAARTKQNISPSELLRLLDATVDTDYWVQVRDKFGEALKYHEQFRNLIAHGLVVTASVLHESGPGGPYTIHEADDDLEPLISFLKKKNVYIETDGGPSYITSLATKDIYELFKGNIKGLVTSLVSGPNPQWIKGVLWAFDYEYFGLQYPK